ncbi:hypothetical protein F4810DRAFT_670701 [Camillea tinctor]|nr:hypothetical protein F4810DRAFT_670701 [Camillea tinctor]
MGAYKTQVLPIKYSKGELLNKFLAQILQTKDFKIMNVSGFPSILLRELDLYLIVLTIVSFQPMDHPSTTATLEGE